MEERKHSMISQALNAVPDREEQEKRYKARINNNAQFMRAQHQVFNNLQTIDNLVAYSLHQNCTSVERVKEQQLKSLISKFNISNVSEQRPDAKKAFAGIIRNRFQGEVLAEDEAEINEDEDYDMDEESEGEEESSQGIEDEVIIDHAQDDGVPPRRSSSGSEHESQDSNDEEDQVRRPSDEEEL